MHDRRMANISIVKEKPACAAEHPGTGPADVDRPHFLTFKAGAINRAIGIATISIDRWINQEATDP